MKGVFVFNQINDIVFINTDDSYKQHINIKALELGLIQKEEINGPLDSNVVLQLLSPLIASQRFMIGQLHNPYTAIKGEGNYIMVFKQFSGYVFLAINGDGLETEEFLNRKLSILHRIITFLHGPCLQQIRPDKQRERNVRWKLIGQMLITWCDLYENQQSFLVEALERLHVNDKVNKTSVELLEAALNGMKASGEKQAVHAMLIAHTKLLALYSSRSATDLSGGDQLMFILLANMLFKDCKTTGAKRTGLTRMSSRETIKLTRPNKGPVKISKHFDREISNTPLLDQSGSNSSESEINQDSEIDDFVMDGFSSENKESGDSTDSQSTLQTSIVKSGLYPKLSESSSSSTTTNDRCTAREPLSRTDGEESSLDISAQDFRHVTMSLPPLSVVPKRNSVHIDLSHHHKNQTAASRSIDLEDKLLVESSLSVRHLTANNSSQKTANHTTNDRHTVPSNNLRTINNFVKGKTDTAHVNEDTKIKDPLQDFSTSYSSSSSSKATDDQNKKPDESEDIEYDKRTVMLQQGDVTNVPHTVHSVLIMEGIYLVIVCELARVTHAKTITQSLFATSELVNALDTHHIKGFSVKQAYDVLESHVKKLGDILKKSKGVPYVERIIVDIGQKWDTAKHLDLIKYTDERSSVHGQARIAGVLIDALHDMDENLNYWIALTTGSNQLNKLEGCLSMIADKLQELFKVLYLSKYSMSSDLQQSIINGVEAVQIAMTKCLSDYKDYINIMAHRNMPMSIYVDEFPGMVHFIFINRSTNVMVSPSFHENLHQEDEHANYTNKLVKEKVWRMYNWFQHHLTKGTTTVTAREGDLYFSYFIWFEDTLGGFPVISPVPLDIAAKQLNNHVAGTISNPYYTTLQKQCFHGQEKKNVCFYELMCVHISLVPTQLALAHCRKLKDKLWKVSVDTNSPISLL